ncbi:conserved hypothetical protein [Cupriavidus taiwanensis]|nr:conserved hypothetical protein [Cupriavidus taiwanensis]SOY50490.1 conserved hypothetical protein [Cupriavidus taiwanensis]SOY83652.1 conserved hypothetical protein [Cupriavidus taiwanensis]SOZ57799.1 conserved hypothetical protein [Cupriavidus taiwanensis]SOZ79689.1 conserved hypothetical protein [Cupriavidus taiwanensis]
MKVMERRAGVGTGVAQVASQRAYSQASIARHGCLARHALRPRRLAAGKDGRAAPVPAGPAGEDRGPRQDRQRPRRAGAGGLALWGLSRPP